MSASADTTRNRPIDVLVVDDSQVMRLLLVHLLESDPHIRVIGAVSSGEEATNFVNTSRPDVILMDIHMPNMDGFEATRRIMQTNPVPIIICSATTAPEELAATFRLMKAGAVACIAKPTGREHVEYDDRAKNLLQTVKLMSEVKVVRRWPDVRGRAERPVPVERGFSQGDVKLVGIGASTGGPPVLQTILSAIDQNFPAPILVVQHISRGFLPGLVDWLSQTTRLQVAIGAHGTRPLPGHVYLAPDDVHMTVGSTGQIQLSRKENESGPLPSVGRLFRSLAEVYGPQALGVLLTGMGRDGAAELRLMKDRGAITVAQDFDSSVVHGMPRQAIALDGATHVLPPDKIAELLVAVTGPGNGVPGNKS